MRHSHKAVRVVRYVVKVDPQGPDYWTTVVIDSDTVLAPSGPSLQKLHDALVDCAETAGLGGMYDFAMDALIVCR